MKYPMGANARNCESKSGSLRQNPRFTISLFNHKGANFGLQILDLKDHFSASVSPSTRWLTRNKQDEATYFNGNINFFA